MTTGAEQDGGAAADAPIVFRHHAPYSTKPVKPPDLYADGWLIGGLILMLLGAGNWLVGLTKTEQYSRTLARASAGGFDQSYLSFDELDDRSDSAVLAPLTRQERNVSYANARMDFYHATFLTGQILFALGLLVAMIGFIGAVRRDAGRSMRSARPRAPTG